MGSGSSSPRALITTTTEQPKRNSLLPTLGFGGILRKVSDASVSLVNSQKLTARDTELPAPTPRELRSSSYNKDQSKKKWTIGSLFLIEYLDPEEPEIDSAVLDVKRKENMSPYDAHHEITSILGTGSFSTVYKCTPRNQRIPHGTYVAVKEIDTITLSLPQIRSIRYEMNILSQLQKHENVITFYCVYVKRLTMYMVMEHCAGGELLDTICTLERYTEDHVRQIMFQLVDAVRYMHHRQIVHRDLHPEIILVKNENISDRIVVKIVDVGYAMQITSQSSQPTYFIFGTPGFIAPEVLIDTVYRPACDIWSLGVMFYVLLSGLMPFSKTNPGKLFSGNYSFPASHFSTVSQAAKDLLADMLEVKSSDRPSAKRILTHVWMESEVISFRQRQAEATKLAKEKEKILAAKRNARIAEENIKKAQTNQKLKKTSDKLVDLIKPISNAKSLSKSYSVDEMDSMVAAFGMSDLTSLEDITRAHTTAHQTKSKPSASSSSSSSQQQQHQHQHQQHPPARRLIDSIALPGSGSSSYNNLVSLATEEPSSVGLSKYKDKKENEKQWGEGKEGRNDEGKERDRRLSDEKDAKERDNVGGGVGPVSPITASTAVMSPTTRTTTEDKHQVLPIQSNSNSTSSGTSNTITPNAVSGSGGGKRNGKSPGTGSGSGSGMLSSVERKKLALVTKNRRNSWSGKSPVKGTHGTSTPGVLSPQISGTLASPNGTATTVSSSSSILKFSPDGRSPGNDESIDRAVVCQTAFVDVHNHKDDSDDGNGDRKDSKDQDNRQSAAMQRRMKANRRRSAPLLVSYDRRGRKEDDGYEDDEEDPSSFVESSYVESSYVDSRRDGKEEGEGSDPDSKELLSPSGEVSPVFSPYVSRTIEVNDDSSSKNSSKNHGGDGASSRYADAKHGSGDGSGDSDVHNGSDGLRTNLIAMQDGNSFRHHRRDDKPDMNHDSNHDNNGTGNNVTTTSPKRNSGNGSFRRQKNSEKMQDSKETNSNSIRRGAVQVLSPVHLHTDQPKDGPSTMNPSPLLNSDYTVCYAPGDLTGNLPTLRQFTTVRKFHTATLKLEKRNPSRRGKHGVLVRPKKKAMADLYSKLQGGDSALDDITEEDAKAALSQHPSSTQLHAMNLLEEDEEGEDDGQDQEGEGMNREEAQITSRMSAKEALARKVSASITSMNLTMPSSQGLDNRYTVYDSNDDTNNYGYYMNSSRSGLDSGVNSGINSAKSSMNSASVGGSIEQFAPGYASNDSNDMDPDSDSRSLSNSGSGSGHGSDPMMKILHDSLNRRRSRSTDHQDTPRKNIPSSQRTSKIPTPMRTTSPNSLGTAISQLFDFSGSSRKDSKGETDNRPLPSRP